MYTGTRDGKVIEADEETQKIRVVAKLGKGDECGEECSDATFHLPPFTTPQLFNQSSNYNITPSPLLSTSCFMKVLMKLKWNVADPSDWSLMQMASCWWLMHTWAYFELTW